MIRVAVIGYGYWGPNLIRNFTGTQGVDMAVCCDLKPESLTGAKARHPWLRVTTDYNEVLKDKTIDAVAIATPLRTHYQLAKQALEHDKHVLVEKPLAATSLEADSLVTLAAKRGLTLMVDHTFVYCGAVRKIKELVAKGDLGALYYYDSVRINLGLFQLDCNVIWDLACHDIAILAHLMEEEPVSVSANGVCHVGNGIENVAYLTLRFASGFIAHIHNNWLAPVKLRTILLGGERKMIVYDDMEPSEKVKVFDRGVNVVTKEDLHRALVSYRLGDMWAPRLDPTEALSLLCKDFVKCITYQERPISDGAMGLRVVKVLEAADLSMKQDGKGIMV